MRCSHARHITSHGGEQMANDPKMDQSVMISFDELDDIGVDGPVEAEEPNAALSQLGINKSTGGHRPIPAARPVHVQQLNINEPKKSNALLYIVLSLCAVGLVAGGVILGGFLNPNAVVLPSTSPVNSSGSQTPPPSSSTPPPSDAVKALLAEDQAKAEAEAVAKAKAEAEAKAKAEAEAAKAAAKASASKRSSGKRAKNRAKSRVAQAKPKAEPPKATEPPPPPPPKKSEAASLLSSLKKGGKGSGSASATPDTKSNLPARLGRSEILSTVRKNQSGINQCKAKLNPGDSRVRVSVRLKIEKSGSVSSVQFLDPAGYKGSPLEDCMKSRVKRFKFPAFSGSPMSIKLPFIL